MKSIIVAFIGSWWRYFGLGRPLGGWSVGYTRTDFFFAVEILADSHQSRLYAAVPKLVTTTSRSSLTRSFIFMPAPGLYSNT
jgi:hypothetical protein